MEWQVLVIIGLICAVLVLSYFSMEKCPKCKTRGGVHKRYEDRLEDEEDKFSDGKAYDVKTCSNCGFIILETYLGETSAGDNR